MPTPLLKAFHASSHAYYKAASRCRTGPSRRISQTRSTSLSRSSAGQEFALFPKFFRFVDTSRSLTNMTFARLTVKAENGKTRSRCVNRACPFVEAQTLHRNLAQARTTAPFQNQSRSLAVIFDWQITASPSSRATGSPNQYQGDVARTRLGHTRRGAHRWQ